MPRAIVIGAGFGGMAAALRLRRKGYDVTLLEKQAQLGGRATQYVRETPLGTFIHDAGPTVVTAKFLFDELFELFGKRREDYFELRDLFPWYRIVFSGMSAPLMKPGPVAPNTSGALVPHFDYGGTLEQMEAQIAKFEPADVAGFRKFLEHSKRIFDIGFTKLGAVPFHEPMTMLKSVPDLIRLQSYKSVWGLAKKYFRNEQLRRVFSFQPLLVGGNPFNTTSIYSLIFHLEREWGVQFAMGGTGAIVRGLEKLMREEGVEIRLGEEVTQLDVVRHWKGTPRVHNLETDHSFDNPFDVLVCNADAPYVYDKLLDPRLRRGVARRLNRKSEIENLKYSMGLFVLYFGTKRTYPEIAHHTIVLGETYRELIEKHPRSRPTFHSRAKASSTGPASETPSAISSSTTSSARSFQICARPSSIRST